MLDSDTFGRGMLEEELLLPLLLEVLPPVGVERSAAITSASMSSKSSSA
jgi:hypothetical protein